MTAAWRLVTVGALLLLATGRVCVWAGFPANGAGKPESFPSVFPDAGLPDTVPADTSAQPLAGAVVTGTRDAVDVRQLPFTVDVVGRARLEASHHPSVLPTLMEQVPGLMLTSRGVMGYGVSTNSAGGLGLRGLGGGYGRLLVLIDGHPQYNGIYGHPISDACQTMLAERVEVLRGPASMLYGSNAMGGVINIVTRSAVEDGSRTRASLGIGSWGTVQAEAGNSLRSGKWSSNVSARYGRSDNHRPEMGFEQYGGYARVGYDIGGGWKLWGEGDVTHFNASDPGPESRPLHDARQWITRASVSAGVDNDYGWTSGRLGIYGNYGRHKINDGTDDLSSPSLRYFRSEDALAGVSLYQGVRLFPGNRSTIGIDWQHIFGHAWYTSIATGETLDTPNKQSGRSHRDELAAYADFRQDLTQWLTVDAGLRIDHHSVTGTEWVPQAGVVVRPMSSGTVKMMVGKGFRNPTMRELYLYPPSNTELEPERIMNCELSWKHVLPKLDYGVNIFYIVGDNLIQTAVVDGRPRNVNTGEVENCGVEVEASWRVGDGLELTSNHSFLHMEHPVLASPEYKGYIGLAWRHGRWAVDGGVTRIDGLYTSTVGDGVREHFTLLGTTLSYRLGSMLRLWVRGDNLLGQRYEINAGFPMPGATALGGFDIEF